MKRLKYILLIIPLFAILVPCVYLYASSVSIEQTVGATTYLEQTVGSSPFNEQIVGEQDAAPATSQIDDYYALRPLLLILPGFLLLAFIVWFFHLGMVDIREGQTLTGIIYWTVSLLLIGVILIVAMPLILGGIESIMWFK
jgi:hypothetical protein